MEINRRKFLQLVAGGAAGTIISRKAFSMNLPGEQAESGAALGVVSGTDPAASARKAVELLGGMKKFVKPGEKVLIKPNISWDRKPEQAATTNPAVVTAVIEMVKEAGAEEITVADNTCNNAQNSYRRSGIKKAAEEAGANVPYVEKNDFEEINIKGEVIRKWKIYRPALKADKIINLPVAKHHGLTVVSLSMKNMMGLIGGRRNLLHQNLGPSIVDLTAYFKPDLIILDAVRILTANGPQGSTLEDVTVKNIIAASTDPVKIDAFGISLFGDREPFNREYVSRYLKIAEDRGLGSSNYKGTGFKKVTLG
ncbi:MAG: DUF362 domain-containing protein [Candidatus Krumholzibacteriales bacterium]